MSPAAPDEGSRHDRWLDGSAYEGYIGRWSRLIARRFLEWLAPEPELTWLDLGCGTGALTTAILEGASPARVLAVDPSEAFVEAARKAIGDPRASYEVANAEALPFGDRSVDIAVSGLVVNFVPDVDAALAEQKRVVRSDGLIAAYVWDYAEGMQLIRRFWDAAIAIDPAAVDLDEDVRFPSARPSALESAWHAARLTDVALTAIDIPTVFADFEELWAPFESGVGPAPGYAAALPGAQRELLRTRLWELLPTAADGSISLTARAWAIRGRRG